MSKIKVCSECGVPRLISEGNRWESDGSIAAFITEGKRAFLYEVDGFDGLFGNLEKSMGLPIDRLVAEGNRKNCVEYLQGLFSGLKGVLARSIFHRRVYNSIADMGALFGYGHFEVLDVRRGESVALYGRNVYCRPMFTGDLMGTFNLMENLPAHLEIEEKGDGFVFTVTREDKPEEELVSRLQSKAIHLKAGDIEYERCPACELPTDFEKLEFDLDEGIITDVTTGRRMTITGMEQMAAIFRELEAELGEDVVRAILDAQRVCVKEMLGKEEMEQGYLYLRRFLAFRGMGNLVEYEPGNDGLNAVVDNASPPLMVAGMLQGIYELLSGNESNIDYRRGGDGTLEVSIRKG
jgi:hypothetical protein